MMFVYRLVTRIAYLLLYPYARWRAGQGNALWQGRLGRGLLKQPVNVWMHAASVGEVKVIGNLVTFIKQARPETTLHLTTMTSTGLDTARSVLDGRASVSAFPLDATPAMVRTLDSLCPQVIVIAETEIWPNLIRLAAGRDIPLVLVNGRMTERSMNRYRPFTISLSRLLACYDRFFFKSETDRGRFALFGVSPDQGEVAGDMKFDAPLTPRSDERVSELRDQLGIGPADFLLLAGSTRPGEESKLLRVFGEVRAKYPAFRMALAPRHLERLDEVKKLLAEVGIPYSTYSGSEPCPGVALVDRMGVLSDLYEAADMAFVGGTLVDIGGHNILEPVWVRTPVVYGPYLGNVVEAAEYIEQHNYGMRVGSVEELITIVEDVIDGQRTFAVREESGPGQTASATVGNYILKRITHA